MRASAALELEQVVNEVRRQVEKEKEIAVAEAKKKKWVRVEQGIIMKSTYKLGYVKRGSTAFKVQKDGCGVPSAARALLVPEGLLMR